VTNYNGMKHEDLYKLIEKYDLEKADYVTINKSGTESLNVKKLANILRLIEIQAGKLDEAHIVDTEGNVEPAVPTKKFHKGFSGMMAQMTFYNSDENELPYVQMALNGLALLVPREKKTWIPKEFIDGVLVNAIATKMKMDVDRDGKIRYIPKMVPRISYSVHDIKHIDVLRKEYDETNKRK
jgi:hypothetical protein